MTTLAREHNMADAGAGPAVTWNPVRLRSSAVNSGWTPTVPAALGDVNIMESQDVEVSRGPLSTMEQHLQRILDHLNTMHTISLGGMASAPRITVSGYARLSVKNLLYRLGKAGHAFSQYPSRR
ncbi:Uncharacterised protein [Raoultella planticola]|uniref:Uncharacterized protein n=1 Tax=Raoultella planticola TaxID=575 RepID=A0A485CLN9_RAOPL|nr:Uncharacterised protein [Raoultella planticola]